jgi:nucleolin
MFMSFMSNTIWLKRQKLPQKKKKSKKRKDQETEPARSDEPNGEEKLKKRKKKTKGGANEENGSAETHDPAHSAKESKKKTKQDQMVEETESNGANEEVGEQAESKKKNKKEKQKGNTETEEGDQEAVTSTLSPASPNFNGSDTSSGRKKTPNQPFRRIDPHAVALADDRLKDNSFWAKGNDSWGAKANDDLVIVKGRDFKHAKTKKKRGSYKGGMLDLGVNSVKFDD